jgi:hypothetical protein
LVIASVVVVVVVALAGDDLCFAVEAWTAADDDGYSRKRQLVSYTLHTDGSMWRWTYLLMPRLLPTTPAKR